MANNFLVLAPLLLPLLGLVISLPLSQVNAWQRWLNVIVSFAAAGSSYFLLADVLAHGPQVYRIGDWLPPYGIVLVADTLTALFLVMASTVVAGGALYALNCNDKAVSFPAFTPLFLGMAAGLHGAFLTGDLFTFFVFLELMVLSSVSLVAISDNRLGLEAAIKYLLISAMGTLFLLGGIAAIYATFGTLNMADIADLLARGERPILAQAAAVMLMSAFLLKSAVFPFHFWQPDFHTTAPTPVHAVLSSVVVKVGVYGLIRLTTLLFTEEAPVIQDLLIVLGLIGIFFGSLGALRTYDAKRMLAYSTFGQIGFILVAIGWGTELALIAAVVYAVNHSFVKAALLMLTGVVSSRTKKKTAAVKEIHGVGKGMALTASLYFLGGMALSGVPPLNGFISKLAVVQGGISAVEAAATPTEAAINWGVIGLVVGAGILTLMYMMRTWQLVFQQAQDDDTTPLKAPGVHDSPLAPALLIGIAIGLGLFATPLIEVATQAVTQLNQPYVYINAVLSIGV